jgi:hypothetical protein
MALDLQHAVAVEHERAVWRPLVESDAPALAELMLAGFRGTPDDEGGAKRLRASSAATAELGSDAWPILTEEYGR